jgi:hypothetical protein
MAWADRSTSCSVVAQEDTLIRIAFWSCHRVPPHQQTPSSCTSSITRSVVASSPKETSTWFKSTSLRIRQPPSAEPLGYPLRMTAAAIDQVRQAGLAQVRERGPDIDRTGPPRGIG